MPKPTKNAPLICTLTTIVALIGIVLGLISGNPLIPILFLFPSVIYEVYRTEGESTILASWGILAVLICELLLFIFKINFNLASFLGESEKYIAGYLIPLGDIKLFGPVIVGILSVILFTRTAGIYTKWLSVVILVTCLVIVFLIDKKLFGEILKIGINQGLNQIH